MTGVLLRKDWLVNLWLLPIAAAAALMPRLIFVFSAPAFEGDGLVYGTVARNILEHGCVSLSDPSGGVCVPHWGGNQLPGYPLFLAATWALTGGWSYAPLVGQSVIYAVAVAAVTHALLQTGAGMRLAMMVSAVLAFSPTLVAWPRMQLTETLALAAALWVFSALLRSLGDRRLRVIELGLAFAVGIFLRYDFVVLSVPVAVVGVYIHGAADALRRGAVIVAIVIVPLGGWMARSIAVGLPPTPPYGLTATGDPAPSGVMGWMRTWVVNQYELPHSVWPLVTGEYAQIRPRGDIYQSESERLRTESLLDELAVRAGGPVPAEIDARFAELAAERRSIAPWEFWVGNPIRRAVAMWFNPFPSMGWPAESGPDRAVMLGAVKEGNWPVAATFVMSHPGDALFKGVVTAWRAIVFLSVLLLLTAGLAGRWRLSGIYWLALTYAAVRTCLLAETILVETRYLVPALAWLEIAVVFELGRRRVEQMT